jgi:hypothetical protein
VKDLKGKVEVFQDRENKAEAAAAAKLAKENAKSKDSWKNEKDKDKDSSDVKSDSKGEKGPKSVPPFGGGPSRSVTPLRSPLSSSAYTTSGIREKQKEKEGKNKDDPQGFDKENSENEVISASAHLSASELRAR